MTAREVKLLLQPKQAKDTRTSSKTSEIAQTNLLMWKQKTGLQEAKVPQHSLSLNFPALCPGMIKVNSTKII